jgi:hypothetical protein
MAAIISKGNLSSIFCYSFEKSRKDFGKAVGDVYGKRMGETFPKDMKG